MATIAILNGPNLNLLGTREPEIYGSKTLKDIEADCRAKAQTHGLEIDFRQTNIEGELVTHIQDVRTTADGMIINAAAYTHTSVAVRDAVIAADLPCIEVHLSNIFKREDFRHHSFLSDCVEGVICGLGSIGYALAIDAMAQRLTGKPA